MYNNNRAIGPVAWQLGFKSSLQSTLLNSRVLLLYTEQVYKMLKSCQYCGRIHDSKYDCGKRPQRRKNITYIDRFRSSRRWRDKREQIRCRDKNLCQICIRNLYGTDIQYNYHNLSVHHAIPIETDYDKRLDDDNLLTVCDVHHVMAEAGQIPYDVIKRIIDEQEEA